MGIPHLCTAVLTADAGATAEALQFQTFAYVSILFAPRTVPRPKSFRPLCLRRRRRRPVITR
jgi:hypothetical protein